MHRVRRKDARDHKLTMFKAELRLSKHALMRLYCNLLFLHLILACFLHLSRTISVPESYGASQMYSATTELLCNAAVFDRREMVQTSWCGTNTKNSRHANILIRIKFFQYLICFRELIFQRFEQPTVYLFFFFLFFYYSQQECSRPSGNLASTTGKGSLCYHCSLCATSPI